MVQTLTGNSARAGRTVRVARAAVLVALFPVWLVAMIGHLFCLRRGLDVCCVDD